jgi:hypothetical protein
MSAIQSRFEVAVPELPDHIDPASYSMCSLSDISAVNSHHLFSDFLDRSPFPLLCCDFDKMAVVILAYGIGVPVIMRFYVLRRYTYTL